MMIMVNVVLNVDKKGIKMKICQQLLTINNYIGKIIEIKNKEVTVFYQKDNSTEVFREHQLDSLEFMIKNYNKRFL